MAPYTCNCGGQYRAGIWPDLQSGPGKVVYGHLHDMNCGRGQAALQHGAELVLLRGLPDSRQPGCGYCWV